MAGEVVDLLDGDAKVQHSCDEGVGWIGGAERVKPSSVGGSGEIEAEVEASAENGQSDLELVEA